MMWFFRRCAVAAAVFVSIAGAELRGQTPVGTALTYQGELHAAGQPAAGPVDLRFTLFPGAAGGGQVGPVLDRPGVMLAEGRFTEVLDFGAGAFGTDARFLQIEVRSPAGSGVYVMLSPRQRVMAAPVAQFARDALSAATAGSANSAANATNAAQFNGQAPAFYQNAANLSSGTIPSARLAGGYSGVLSLSNAGNTFAGSGAGLTNVNADLLDGLDSGAFLQSIPMPLHINGTHSLAVIGGFNFSTNSNSAGVAGYSYAETGGTMGVYAVAQSNEGTGVFGWASNNVGSTYGVFGLSNGTTGYGVFGRALANTGANYGVHGVSDSTSGTGVWGRTTRTSGITTGGRFESASTLGHGVIGLATAATGTTYGGRFESTSTGGRGIMGYAAASSGFTYGGYFQNNSSSGHAVFGWATAASGTAFGGNFLSESTGGRGVFGSASAASGQTTGVYGLSASPDGRGVFGTANAGFGGGNGVRGESNSPDGRGVLGYASASNGLNYGVRGQSDSPSGYGVYSVGRLGASGVKSFRIDHPDDPANKYLLHYAAESPEVINFYRGTVMLDSAGSAVVELPAYFAKVNRDPSYQLTAVGAAMPMLHIALKISEESLRDGGAAGPGEAAPLCTFQIAGGSPGGEVSWEVKAARNDAWVRANGAPVEVEKEGLEKGKYQHPEHYNQPREMGVERVSEGGPG